MSRSTDRGAAVVELVLLGVVLLAPLLYLVLAVSTVQRSVYGVTHAAREAGRGYATGTAANAQLRAEYAARLAVADQGIPVDGVEVRYAAADADCASADRVPRPLAPGEVFAVCVTGSVTVPGVPRFLDGRRNTVTGRHVVQVDDYRDLGSR